MGAAILDVCMFVMFIVLVLLCPFSVFKVKSYQGDKSIERDPRSRVRLGAQGHPVWKNLNTRVM